MKDSLFFFLGFLGLAFGATTAATTTTPLTCKKEEYKFPSQKTCVSCPSGATCDGNSLQKCGAKQYIHQVGGLTVCADCPAGATCDGSGGVDCGEGKYARNDKYIAVICSTCPADATCEKASIKDCGKDKYKTHWDAGCAACPAGAKCADNKITDCGSTDKTIFHFECYNCPTGFTCDGKNLRISQKTGTGSLVPKYANKGIGDECEQGVPITNVEDCKAEAPIFYSELSVPYGFSGCGMYHADGRLPYIIFNGMKPTMGPVAHHFKVCKKATLSPASRQVVTFNMMCTTAVLAILLMQ